MSERRPEPGDETARDAPRRACPVCGRPVEPGSPAFPFCSKRCRLADLGSWLGERYRVTRPIEQRDLEEG